MRASVRQAQGEHRAGLDRRVDLRPLASGGTRRARSWCRRRRPRSTRAPSPRTCPRPSHLSRSTWILMTPTRSPRARSRPSRARRSRGSTSRRVRRPRRCRRRSPRARRRARPRRCSRSRGSGRPAPRRPRSLQRAPAAVSIRACSAAAAPPQRRYLREDLVALARADVGQRQVAAEVGDHARVHHAAPDGRDDGEHDHPGVPGRQHRGLLVVAQRLVAPGRVGVVVAVPLQVVEQHVGRDVVGVPAVAGVDPLVALALAVADLLAQHPVVLHVVDDLEQREADDRLDHEQRQDPEPSTAISAPQSTADISQALSTSLPIRNGCLPLRA